MGQLIDQQMNKWKLGCVSGIPPPPPDFALADDIISNLAKERESVIEIIERTMYLLSFRTINRNK